MKLSKNSLLVSALVGAAFMQSIPAAPDASAWQDRVGYRFAPLAIPPGNTGFTRLPANATGVTFTNVLSDERSAANRNLLSGSGVAAGDVDGDGLADLYFCGLDADNRFYRNLGNWRFEDLTAKAGVGCPGQDSTGAAFADVDGDGDLDLLVAGLGHGVRLFRNDSAWTFTEITDSCGLASHHGSMSLTLADIDGDTDLDLYVSNYRPVTIRDRPRTRFEVQPIQGQPVVVAVDGRSTTAPDLTNRFEISPSGEVIEHSEESDLFLNNGQGQFQRVSWTGGRFRDEQGLALTRAPRDWSLSVRFHDFTGDGAPDLYVCNDLFSPDRIWINDGQGNFRAQDPIALRHTSSFSMGIDFGDLDRDGDVDFYVVDMVSRDLRRRKVQIAGLSPSWSPVGVISNQPQYFQNTLQVNRGDGTFAELAHFAGLEASEWSWHPVFLDVDLDGYEDILVVNGMLRDFQNADLGDRIESAVAARNVSMPELVAMFREFPGLYLPNLLFHNQGGLRFDEAASRWGFDDPGIAQGLALADLDRDGDLDVAMNNLKGVASLYRNNSAAPRIAVRLTGSGANTRGVGALITVRGLSIPQSQEMIAAGRYLSSDDPIRAFAVGHTTNRMSIEVAWRSGRHTLISDAPANSLVEIAESGPASPAPSRPAPAPTRFEDVSDRLGHTHHEEPFDDFSRQFLLPNLHSQLGPGVAWIDLDSDGWEDLAMGSGRGGKLGLYRNTRDGRFVPWSQSPAGTAVPRDTAGLVSMAMTNNSELLLAASSNYEDGLESGAMVRIYDWTRQTTLESFPGQRASAGPITLGDLDLDGDLDLFVGGREIPARYPEPAPSLVFLNQNGTFHLDLTNSLALTAAGLVSGAVFADLNQDGAPDLVLACEWGPIRVLRNENGRLIEITESLRLGKILGWWNGVAVGDLDGDGRLDIVASNWGWNTRYRGTADHPRRLDFGSIDAAGQLGLIESCFDPALQAYVPERDLRVLGMGMPILRDRFRSHQQFAETTLHQLLGRDPASTPHLDANTLASTVFLNRGDHFEPRPLPAEAQWAPAFAVCIADFDGDTREDIFLSQNFFATQPLTPRCDAGRSLLLLGDGQGGFQPQPGQESGLLVYGEQRGAASADFDHDGRTDLVITQNGGATRLFRNRTARPGLRITLQGGALNPRAIGATLRLKAGDRALPARVLTAGSGYWSQDGWAQVLSAPAGTLTVLVRWPGGAETTSQVPQDATAVTIRPDGSLSEP